MNVRIPPFDDVRVRQAVNMAINKDRIVRVVNNRAVPANQPLPPTMPGYAEDYQGYAFDPEKAKALLAEAGHPDGRSEEHTSELQSLMRISYAVFCLKKKQK